MSEPVRLPGLPLFPLQAVLFPGGSLALRIFEVRYLHMIKRCHQDGSPFGVVALTRGAEVRRPRPVTSEPPSGDAFADEAFFDVGTLATITHFERPQAGLMLLQAVGSQRFRLDGVEQLPHGQWVGDAELLADDTPVAVPDDLDVARQGLRQLLETLRLEGRPVPLADPLRWDDCGWLANRWCELLPLETAVAQRFMVLDNPLVRLELVVDTLRQIGFAPPETGGATAG